MRKLLTLLLFAFFTLSSVAMTMSISGAKRVALYSQPNANAQMIEQLNKGEPVKLLKTNLENGYSYIETAKHAQGWLKTEYLVQMPKRKKAGLFSRVWHQLFGRHQHVVVPAAVASQVKVKVPAKQIISVQQTSSMQQEISTLQQGVLTLKQQQHNHWIWFMWGAIILSFGFCLGLWFGAIRSKRRHRSMFR